MSTGCIGAKPRWWCSGPSAGRSALPAGPALVVATLVLYLVGERGAGNLDPAAHTGAVARRGRRSGRKRQPERKDGRLFVGLLAVAAIIALLTFSHAMFVAVGMGGWRAPAYGFGGALVGFLMCRFMRALSFFLGARLVGYVLGLVSNLDGWLRPNVLPDEWTLAVNAFIAAFCVTALVFGLMVLAGWQPPKRHHVTVWELPGRDDTDRDDSYQAWCECEWHSNRYRLSRPDAEAAAFAAARGHSPKVARRVRFEEPT